MSRNRITKTQIAKAAGVSHTCVSQVLNQVPNARISETTRKLILEHSRRLGYAGSKSTRVQWRTASIGYVVFGPRPRHTLYSWSFYQLYDLQRLAIEDDRDVVFMGIVNEAASINGFLRRLKARRPLGLILDGHVSDTVVHELHEREIPFVIMGETSYAHDPSQQGKANTVSSDTKGAIFQLMQWFHRRGARRVSLSVGPISTLIHSLIFDGYREAIEKLGLAYDPALVQIGEETQGRDVVKFLGRLGVEYDGILLGSADRAHRAMPHLQLLGDTSDHERLIGIYGTTETVPEFPQNVTLCGASYRGFAEAAYSILAKEINYASRKKQQIVVPNQFHEGTASHMG